MDWTWLDDKTAINQEGIEGRRQRVPNVLDASSIINQTLRSRYASFHKANSLAVHVADGKQTVGNIARMYMYSMGQL
jgi:hypothetical protein